MCSTKAIKKQKILDAAYNLFLKNGYNSTKIIDIAEAAGVGKGTIYEYFESKESLLLSIVAEGMEDYIKECNAVSEATARGIEKLESVVELEASHIKQNGLRILKMSQMMMDTGMPEEFLSQVKELWNQKFYLVKKILEDGVKSGEFREMNTELVAVVIMSATSGYLNIKYGIPQIEDVELPFDVDRFQQKDLMSFLLKGMQA